MRSDLLVFVGLRLLSGLLSLVFFSLLARWFSAAETKPLYYFLFLSGFFASVLRTLITVAAALRHDESKAMKLRRLCRAYALVLMCALFLIPVALWVCNAVMPAAWVAATLIAFLLLWGVDVDILRAALGRPGLVAPLGALGALLAMASVTATHSPQGAFAAILLQWAPLCAVNAYVLWRLRRRVWASFKLRGMLRHPAAWVALATATFDGVVLNAPFFLSAITAPELGKSIGVVTRVFATSVILMPLLTHWSNGNALGKTAGALGVPVPLLFGGLIAGTGLCAGAAVALMFAFIAGTPPSGVELMASTLLLLGFAATAASARYCTTQMWVVALGLVLVGGSAIVAVRLTIQGAGGVLAVAGVQAVSLCLGAAWMFAMNRVSRKAKQVGPSGPKSEP